MPGLEAGARGQWEDCALARPGQDPPLWPTGHRRPCSRFGGLAWLLSAAWEERDLGETLGETGGWGERSEGLPGCGLVVQPAMRRRR